MIDFLLSSMYVTDMLLTVFISLAAFSRRKLFILRIIGGIAVCLTVNYFLPYFFDIFMEHGVAKSFILYAVSFMFVIGASLFAFKIGFLKALFINSTCYFIQHLSFALDRTIRGEVQPSLSAYFSHFIPLAAVYAVVWLLYIRKLDDAGMDALRWNDVTFITVGIMFICVFLNSFAGERGEDTLSYRLADVCCNIVGVFCQYGIYSGSVLRNNREKTEQLLALKAEQYRITKENADALNIKCHDLKHLIREYKNNETIDNDAFDEIKRIIDDYECSYDTGSPALDIILTEKATLCKNKGIRLTCVADGASLCGINPNDIYALFGNALDNAVESAEKCPDEKKTVGLTVRAVGNMCIVNIQNYTRDNVEFKRGLPVTTKKDKSNHGFGTRSLKYIVNRYGGEIAFVQNGDVFSVNIVLPAAETKEQNIAA